MVHIAAGIADPIAAGALAGKPAAIISKNISTSGAARERPFSGAMYAQKQSSVSPLVLLFNAVIWSAAPESLWEDRRCHREKSRS
jgi:hypothetical protein